MIVLHVDANSAYLSWTAAELLKNGHPVDIREIDSAIAGDPEQRHGVILAKSTSAKKKGIRTGESLFEAFRKCPNLELFPPDHKLYAQYSKAMYALLSEYTPQIERFSIDEYWLDYTASESRFGPAEKVAYEIRDRIREELGFTVNVGVSSNKLLAKMASELEKPNRVHTLWPEEIPDKLWPLPVRDLFMVGPAAERKLIKSNIRTIGDLAQADPAYLRSILKSHGETIWQYARGIDNSPVHTIGEIPQKGYGNGITVSHDVTNRDEARGIILSLVDKVSMRLRAGESTCNVVTLSLTYSDFRKVSRQRLLPAYTASTTEIKNQAFRLLDELWKGAPIRQITVSVSGLAPQGELQLSLTEYSDPLKDEKVDQVVDQIRKRFGSDSLVRGRLAGKASEDPRDDLLEEDL
ncbi:MAG: DNA polymerase IV [Firmicutes bacterium]|nr:DNA polymerase IV [Bacillota bacterium]